MDIKQFAFDKALSRVAQVKDLQREVNLERSKIIGRLYGPKVKFDSVNYGILEPLSPKDIDGDQWTERQKELILDKGPTNPIFKGGRGVYNGR